LQIEFEDDDLRQLYTNPGHGSRRDAGLVKQFRKVVGFVANAYDERDLYSYRALRFEKLKGARASQHSMRLNDQWRLIVRLEDAEQRRVVVIVEIIDYH